MGPCKVSQTCDGVCVLFWRPQCVPYVSNVGIASPIERAVGNGLRCKEAWSIRTFQVLSVKKSAQVWQTVPHAHLKAHLVRFDLAAGAIEVVRGNIIIDGNTTFVDNSADDYGGEA